MIPSTHGAHSAETRAFDPIALGERRPTVAEVEERALKMEKVVPDFILPSLDGKQVSPRNYRQRSNLVLCYLDLDRCADCTGFLKEMADNYHVYVELETEILVVAPQSISDLQGRLGSMGLPFPVMSDEGGDVGRVYLDGRFQEKPVGCVFVTDRFGALREEIVAKTDSDLPNQASILDWLNLIEMECPECGDVEEDFRA